MAPTNHTPQIEGHSYKEYRYSPVEASIPSAVYCSTTLPDHPDNTRNDSSHQSEGYVPLESGMAEKGSKILQYMGAITGNLCSVSVGMVMGWNSPMEKKLEQKDPIAKDNPLGFAVTEDEFSWIGSLIAIGAIFGSLAAGYIAERCGRKKAMLLSVAPFTIGWVMIATAKTLAQFYSGRLILGFAIGFPFCVLPMYIGEIVETSIRGALNSLMQMFISLGLVLAYSIGPFTSYTVFWIACMSSPIIFLVSFITMPESPYFLLSKGRKEEALVSLARLRGKSIAGVQKEADEMQAVVEEAYRNQGSFADLYRNKTNCKALMLTCALVGFQQFSGINAVLFYTERIFTDTKTSSGPISAIIVGSVMMVAAMVTPLVIDRLGRKVLLMISGIGETVTLGALGVFFYMQANGKDVSGISWLPVTSLVIYMIMSSLGWGPLPWTVMGEMFASDIKSKASSITVCFCWILTFLITKFFSNIALLLGKHVAFWIFGCCCVGSVFFVRIFLPETKGKSLSEIQDELSGVKRTAPDLEAVEPEKK